MSRSSKARAARRLKQWRPRREEKLRKFDVMVENQKYLLVSLVKQWMQGTNRNPQLLLLEDLVELIQVFGHHAPGLILHPSPRYGEKKLSSKASAEQALGPAVDEIVAMVMQSAFLSGGRYEVDPERLAGQLKGVARNGNARGADAYLGQFLTGAI